MRFRRARSSRAIVEKLPLTALLDVIFFLLLYFIMAGSLTPPESQLAAAITAERRGAGGGGSLSAQVVYVEAGSAERARYRLGARVIEDQQQLAAVLAALPKDPGVVVRASDEAPTWATAGALQAAHDAGFVRISYVGAGASPARRTGAGGAGGAGAVGDGGAAP